jgi:hypothetical protein
MWMNNDNLIAFNRFGNYGIITIKILNQIKDKRSKYIPRENYGILWQQQVY